MDPYFNFLVSFRMIDKSRIVPIQALGINQTLSNAATGIFNKFKKLKESIKTRSKTKIAGYKVFVDVEEGMDSNFEGSGGDERIAFGPMAKGQKKYGSTSRRLKSEDSQGVAYQVQKGDTLPGIALKFGVTTEQIRRANHLWANDSLFLRDKLIIPTYLENGSGDVRPSCSTNSLSSTSHDFNGSITSNNSQNSSRGNIVCSSIISSPQDELSYTSPQTPSTSNSGASNNKHWTHPLSDSFEFEDCLSSPSSIRLESEESTTPNSKHDASAWSPINETGYQSAHRPNYTNGRENESFISSNGFTSPQSQSSPASPTPGGPSRRYSVKDHSEKSVHDFLSRIDNAIATSKRQAKSIKHTKPWVTFESDSESEQRHSGTSLLTQGRQLRYSLRKLEKKQEELFQL